MYREEEEEEEEEEEVADCSRAFSRRLKAPSARRKDEALLQRGRGQSSTRRPASFRVIGGGVRQIHRALVWSLSNDTRQIPSSRRVVYYVDGVRDGRRRRVRGLDRAVPNSELTYLRLRERRRGVFTYGGC